MNSWELNSQNNRLKFNQRTQSTPHEFNAHAPSQITILLKLKRINQLKIKILIDKRIGS